MVNFSAFSGDWSPVHSDEEWCKQHALQDPDCPRASWAWR
ncbi:MAG: hypothetical protein MZU79_08845 [Anaerotruncus sp.]|nr:hypothetical protein [Anaerotruncus sp.]